MKNSTQALVIFALLLGSVSCGGKSGTSNLDWEQSRANSARYAYLWDRDLEDEFYFGASVIAADDFLSGALEMSIDPITVKLSLEQSKLLVNTLGDENILSFDVTRRNNQNEIDFESSGNDLQFSQEILRQLINYFGGPIPDDSENVYWVSEDAPQVTFIDQDNDTVVVNLKHTVRQVRAEEDAEGNLTILEELSERPGDVVVRIWLKRKTALAQLTGGQLARTVGAAKNKDLGFFPSDFDMTEAGQLKPIQRMALGDAHNDGVGTIYYLKDFPAAYVDAARNGILAWNKAFPANQKISVEVAPDNIDVGDPRYHVVKWFDNTDNSLQWAGIARMITDPETGLVMSGGVYVQGSSVIEDYKGITNYTKQASAQTIKAVGRIGNVDFKLAEGESPIIPYFTDSSASFESYMQGYYQETVTHEVGHVLGLRHNFRASAKLDAHNHSASIMDYVPRANRNDGAGPGYYDIAAIKWAYFGQNPTGPLPYCSDEDIENLFDCNQGDFGDVVNYAARSLVDGTNVLSQSSVPVLADVWISSMKGSLDIANKILRLKSQLTSAQRATAQQKLPAAISYAMNAKPDASLTGAQLETVKKNLALLKQVLASQE
ncbi:MAG: zinc-dependent metalloprotease [Oligoflexales bacterium]